MLVFLRRLTTGFVMGAVSAVGMSGHFAAALPHALLPANTALAANTCSNFVGSKFTGIRATGFGGSSPASGIIGQFTINQPSFLCNGGLSYWDMVYTPASQCSGSNYGVYAQAGWLDDGAGNPQHFYERAENLFAPNCDPGPWIWQSAAWSSSHNYKVVEGNQSQGGFASFYTDGVLMNTLAIDWAGTQYQIAGEINYSEEYMGGQQIRSLYHCEAVSGCTPNLAFNVGNLCPSGNTEGCLQTYNPNGCYLYNASTTTAQGFNVYEKRSKSPPSC